MDHFSRIHLAVARLSVLATTTLALAAPASAQESFKLGIVTFLSGPAADSFGVPARNGGQFVIGKAERHGASQSEGLARRPISRTAGLRERNPPAAKAFGILAKRPGRGLHSPRWRKKTRAGYENYGVFSGLALAPSPPPVPAALALLGLVSLPGAP